MNTEKHVDTPLLLTTIAATLLLVAGCSDSGPSSGADAMDPAGNPSVSQESGQDAIETGEQEVTTDPDSAESGMTTQPVLMNTARYQLEFVSDWSAETHPVNFPPNPHFSGLVGAVHNEQVIFWQPGQLASDGVEVVAESGSKSTFLSEIENAVNDGTAKAAIDGSGITLSPGTTSVEFEVTRDYPLVSVLSMLAPSPDWIVGVDRLNLIEDGEFIGGLTIELALYDAGTDSGASFVSTNEDTQPREIIQRLSADNTQADFVDGLPVIGRFNITKLP